MGRIIKTQIWAATIRRIGSEHARSAGGPSDRSGSCSYYALLVRVCFRACANRDCHNFRTRYFARILETMANQLRNAAANLRLLPGKLSGSEHLETEYGEHQDAEYYARNIEEAASF